MLLANIFSSYQDHEGLSDNIATLGAEKLAQFFSTSSEPVEIIANIIFESFEKLRETSEYTAGTFISEVCSMVDKLGVFNCSVEPRLLRYSTEYYTLQSQSLIASDEGVIEKLQRLQDFRNTEIRLYEELYPKPCFAKFLAALDQTYTFHLVKLILEKFSTFMKTENTAFLRCLYEIATTVGLEESVARGFKDHIERTIDNILLARSSTPIGDTIEKLCDFKDELDALITASLSPSFKAYQRDTFEVAFNKDSYLISKCICASLNVLLSVSSTESTKSAVSERLLKILGLFRFLHAKDIFETLYSKDLSKRLLFHRNKSMDLERTVLYHLKDQCGATFTAKLDSMFHDLEVSSDIQTNYQTSEGNLSGAISSSFQVLNKHFWPLDSSKKLPSALDAGLLSNCRSFEKYFLKAFPKRKLEWASTSSTCVIIAHLPKVITNYFLRVFRHIASRETRSCSSLYRKPVSWNILLRKGPLPLLHRK